MNVNLFTFLSIVASYIYPLSFFLKCNPKLDFESACYWKSSPTVFIHIVHLLPVDPSGS